MKKVIKTDTEFNNFCDNNNVIFKLPQENSGKYYMLINTFTSEASTGLSDSNNKCDAIYLSKIPLTKGGIDAFSEQNQKQDKIYFSSISSEDQSNVIHKFSEFIYRNGIWYYDNEDCIEMLDE